MAGTFRALDLTDEQGFFCGRTLADLGADVIKVERPGGDPSRNIGPFYLDRPGPETSLFWFAYNANKRGVTLNLESVDGRSIFTRLVKAADVLIESFPCGYLDDLGLGYGSLSKANPGLVVASITPFGSTGPYSRYKSCELVNMAMSGLMNLSGDPDRPPVIISFPHACLHAGTQAAVAVLAALYHREETGRGQHIDVAVRESVIQMIAQPIAHWKVNRVRIRRAGQQRIGWGPGLIRQIWPCKDGFVIFVLGGGLLRAQTNRSLVTWMDEGGMAGDLTEVEWEKFDMVTTTEEFVRSFEEKVGAFFLTLTKAELFEEGIGRHVDIYPVADCSDVARQVQLQARDFWVDLEHEDLGTHLTYPGEFAKSTERAIRPTRRAPRPGEHNDEVYRGELGLTRAELITLKQAGVI